MKRIVFWTILLAWLGLAGTVMADNSDYRVGDGDILKVTVYDHPDLTTVVRLSSGGQIHFPLIGQVQIGGLTVYQAADVIASRLSGDYIINPQVSVFIEEFRSKKVTIMGEVDKPGLYELSGLTTLLELISKAGGLQKDAGDRVTIHRKAEGRKAEEALTINLKDLMESKDASADVLILDGDNVYVAKAGIFYVTGEVKRPDTYRLEEGLTVIKAITMAGGFTNLAAKTRVKIIRKINGQEHVIERVSMYEPVLPDDVMVVPESFF